MKRVSIPVVLAAALVMAPVDAGAASAADKCEASKNKIAGSYFACREKAEAKAIVKMTAPDYGKCTAKFDEKFAGAETKGDGMCPDDVLTAPMNAYLAALASDTAAILAGAPLPSCGDELINAVGEQCDGAELGGATCASFGHAFGTLQCSGLCQFDTGACSSCPGAIYLGECYVLGPATTTCDDACGSYGMVYDEATLEDVGSNGSDVDCANVLNALDVPGAGLGYSGACTDGVGCAYDADSVTRFRCTSPATTSFDLLFTSSRVCACH